MGLVSIFDELRADVEKQGRSLPSAQYRGATTAACFADPQEEFSALLDGCGVYDLGFRTRISITGQDRVRWLNGMVSNNIRDLAAGHGVYAFLLNPQGRILGDMYAFNMGDSLIVETDRNQLEKIMATFDHYIIMDDVLLTDVGENQVAIGLAGPKAQALLNAAGIRVQEMQPLETVTPQCSCDCGCLECSVVHGEDILISSYEIWLKPEDAHKAWKALINAGAVPVGSETLERLRIAMGIPLYGVDIRERDLPQETEQMRALNFNKGCYIGQEIVERIRSRGNVHRKFTGFLSEPGTGIAPDTKVFADGKEVGEITSASGISTPLGERAVALGYIRRDFGVPGREVTIGDARASVIALPVDLRGLKQVDEAALHRV